MGDKRAESKVTLVYGQMNEPPGARARVALTGECMHTLALFQDSAETYAVFAPFSPCFDQVRHPHAGLTVAEYFRDIEGQDVLLFVDNIFRFTQANSEVSALLGRIPSAVGYQPTLATDLGGLQERITTTTKGSITSVQVRPELSSISILPYLLKPRVPSQTCRNHVCAFHHHKQAVYVPADDLTDPAPATTFAHLDATTVLSRSIAELGIYPAVDPLDSTSRMLNPLVIGLEHYGVARGVQKVLQDYKNLQVR